MKKELLKLIKENPNLDIVVMASTDDLDYVIDDYDGIETLHQKVQEWWVNEKRRVNRLY